MSITKTDKHARSCGACSKPRNTHKFAVTVGNIFDPKLERYQLCATAQELYRVEREAMALYRASGPLPAVNQEGK